MKRDEDVRSYVVLGIDITRYSDKSLGEQKWAQEVVDRLLHDAINGSPASAASRPEWLDGGDGGYAVFTWSERQVIDLLDDFSEMLERENTRSNNDHRVSVRVALHVGQLIRWTGKLGLKFTGHTLNDCARLLAGMKRDQIGQVVCSGAFFDAISTYGTTAKTTRLLDTVDKHSHSHRTYNLCRDPGLGVDPPEEDLFPDPFER